jgi:hypothetical protein
MTANANSGGQDAAARLLRALERGATTGIEVARSVHDRWRGMPTPAAIEPVAVEPDVSEIDVRDLRAELARELARLSGA